MNLWSAVGVALCALTAVLVLREIRKETAGMVVLAFCIFALWTSLPALRQTVAFVQKTASLLPQTSYIQVLLRAVGISVLTDAGCEICKSAGETGIARYVLLLGKAELVLLSLPLMQTLVSLATGFLGV